MPPPPNPAPRSPNPASLQETLRFTYLSELLGRRLLTVGTGRRLGRIVDLTASPEKVYPRITGLLVKPHFRGEPLYIPWSRIHWPGTGGKITVDDPPAGADGPARPAETDILLKKSFLDRQLISTSGYKVVRVNDLHLLLEKTGSENPLALPAVARTGSRGDSAGRQGEGCHTRTQSTSIRVVLVAREP